MLTSTSEDTKWHCVVFQIFPNSILRLTNLEPTANIELKGLSNVLDNLAIEVSHPHLLGKGRTSVDSSSSSEYSQDIGGYVQKLNIPISVKRAFWNGDEGGMTSPLHVLLSSEGQSIKVPVKIRFRSDKCGNMELGWGTLFYFVVDHYQSAIMIFLSCLLCTFITKVRSNIAVSAKCIIL